MVLTEVPALATVAPRAEETPSAAPLDAPPETKPSVAPLGVRETSSHLRRPRPHLIWGKDDGGKRQQLRLMRTWKTGQPVRYSAVPSQPPRAIAPYVLVLDLSFSAYFTFTAGLIKRQVDGHEIEADASVLSAFFSLLAPVVWQWNQANLLLNMFDPEDISTELMVVVLSASLISLADTTPRCFYIGVVPGDEDDPGEADCVPFATAFAAMKAIVLIYAAYYACFAPGARILAARSTCGVLVTIAALVALVRIPSGDDNTTRAVLFGSVEFVIELATTFAPLPCSLCQILGLPFVLALPLDLRYSEQRWERLFFITLGAVIARAVTTLDDDFSTRIVGTYALLPWMTFLIKCQYFDLASHSTATPGHAMRTSRLRGFLWALLHVPLIGSVQWVSVAVSQLTVFDADGGHVPKPWETCGRACEHSSRALIMYMLTNLLLQLTHAGDGDAAAGLPPRRLSRPARVAIRLLCIGSQVAVMLVATDRLSAMNYLVLLLGLLTVGTAVEVWGKRHRSPKQAPDAVVLDAPPAGTSAPLLQ